MADYHGQSTNPEVKLLGKTNADFEPGSETLFINFKPVDKIIYLKKDKIILASNYLEMF